MNQNSEKIRYILQYHFDQGDNASQACEKIRGVYGEDALSAARKWFDRFRSGNFGVKDAPRSGRPIVEKVDEILQKIEEDQHISSYDITAELNINQKSFEPFA